MPKRERPSDLSSQPSETPPRKRTVQHQQRREKNKEFARKYPKSREAELLRASSGRSRWKKFIIEESSEEIVETEAGALVAKIQQFYADHEEKLKAHLEEWFTNGTPLHIYFF
jgi:hypothetical protein